MPGMNHSNYFHKIVFLLPSFYSYCATNITTSAALWWYFPYSADLSEPDGCSTSYSYKSWTCSVSQFKSIIKPAPISTAIKLSEPQINLADREILLEYSDQYCSPGLEGEQGTLKAYGSASSLGEWGAGGTTPGLSILKSWWRRSATERRESIEHTELFTAEARAERRYWQVIDTDNLTLDQYQEQRAQAPRLPDERKEISVKHETNKYYAAVQKQRHRLMRNVKHTETSY